MPTTTKPTSPEPSPCAWKKPISSASRPGLTMSSMTAWPRRPALSIISSTRSGSRPSKEPARKPPLFSSSSPPRATALNSSPGTGGIMPRNSASKNMTSMRKCFVLISSWKMSSTVLSSWPTNFTACSLSSATTSRSIIPTSKFSRSKKLMERMSAFFTLTISRGLQRALVPG